MAKNQGEGEITEHQLQRNSSSNSNSAPQNTNINAPLQRRNAPFLIVCRCFSVITAASAALCIAVNVLSAVRSFKNGSDVGSFCFLGFNFYVLLLLLINFEWFVFCGVLGFWWDFPMLCCCVSDFCGFGWDGMESYFQILEGKICVLLVCVLYFSGINCLFLCVLKVKLSIE